MTAAPHLLLHTPPSALPSAAASRRLLRDRTCFDHCDEVILRNLPPPTVKCRFPRETGRSQAPRRQQDLKHSKTELNKGTVCHGESGNLNTRE
ncbi:hypothetical protein F511_35923 [Dorcoceras hygrometricum]|uniref:Uncharacterized protein n=1 Tax=Dorcoceras hygrometricum TaxID=472368 RepID=A0A2Z7ABL6_9LAMI|nr:hypothetical protein F511_35923 [Dorcoceras hygrometricum]